MIYDKALIYLGTENGIDCYKFKARPLKYFYTPMAYYENLKSRTVRETIDYFRGGYNVIYLAVDDKLIGYGTITRGGGRNKFCTKDDAVICNLWIQPDERGKGYGKKLDIILTRYAESHFKGKTYMYIHNENLPSKKAAEYAGFVKVANATRRGRFVNIVNCEKGNLEIYCKSKDQLLGE